MTSAAPTARLDRLLSFLDRDADNLALRKDAVCEAFTSGHWRSARELIDAGLQVHADDAELIALSGFSYLQSGRYHDADEALSAAMANGVDAPEVRCNLALSRFMSRRYAQALDLLTDSVLKALPPAQVLRARCLHHLQRPQEAMAGCRAHLAAAQDDAEAHGLLGLLLHEQNRSSDAKQHIETALRRDPKQLDALLASALIQADDGQYDAARGSFDMLLQSHPNCGRARYGRALIELRHMRLEPAKQDMQRAAAHMPEHIGTWHVLAWIHLLQGELAAAERAFERAMTIDRNFSETHGGLAAIAALQGREEEAQVSLKRALRLDPQSMSAQYARLVLLQRAGKHDEVQAVLDAFLARPVSGSDMQFRDLIATHVKYLKTSAGRRQDGLRA